MVRGQPTTTAEAHELLIQARSKRLHVQDGTTHWANHSFDLARADAMEQAAREFLALKQPAEFGTGGEMVPQGRDASDYPGIACLVREPDLTAAHASRDRLRLADEAGCFDLAADMGESVRARDSAEKALLHQMAAAHATALRVFGRVRAELDGPARVSRATGQNLSHAEVSRLANAAARLLQAYQQGFLALHKGRSGNKQVVQVVHQHVDARGGTVAVAGAVSPQGGGSDGGGGEK